MIFRGLMFGLLLVGATCAYGQTFSFELFALEGGNRRLVNAGTLPSSQAETTSTRWPREPKALDKQLALRNGFTVGLSDHEEPRIEGIGFWLKRVPSPMEASQYPGFSWEWFDVSSGNVFEKLKGPGRIRIGTRRVKGRDLVERMDFLSDITFQLNVDERGAPGTYTHELRIKKDSALVFNPQPKDP